MNSQKIVRWIKVVGESCINEDAPLTEQMRDACFAANFVLSVDETDEQFLLAAIYAAKETAEISGYGLEREPRAFIKKSIGLYGENRTKEFVEAIQRTRTAHA